MTGAAHPPDKTSRMHTAGTGEAEWRSPTNAEAACLRAVVSQTADHLLSQLDGLRVRPGCPCGCGTLDLEPAGGRSQNNNFPITPMPGSIDVIDTSGEVVGGIILFVDGGQLSTLEIYSFDDQPLQLPPRARLRFGQG
jgi:hypothetical protein